MPNIKYITGTMELAESCMRYTIWINLAYRFYSNYQCGNLTWICWIICDCVYCALCCKRGMMHIFYPGGNISCIAMNWLELNCFILTPGPFVFDIFHCQNWLFLRAMDYFSMDTTMALLYMVLFFIVFSRFVNDFVAQNGSKAKILGFSEFLRYFWASKLK